jgi:hypothetical protein
MIISGYLIGAAARQDISGLFPIGLSVIIFYFGFVVSKDNQMRNDLFRLAWVCSSVFALLAALGLSGIGPFGDLVTVGRFAAHGAILERMQIFTDINFVAMYVIPLAAALYAQGRWFTLRLALAALGAWVLLMGQSRSGLIVYVVVALAMLMLRVRRLSILQLMGGALFAANLCVLLYGTVQELLEPIVLRTSDVDGMDTIEHRLLAYSYLAEKLLVLQAWFGLGTDEFVLLYGDLPHSNATAFFLEAGLIGFVGWLGLFVLLLVKAAFGVLWSPSRYADGDIMLVGCALGIMLAQLTLFVTTQKLPWLWAGIIAGMVEARALHQMRQPERRYH